LTAIVFFHGSNDKYFVDVTIVSLKNDVTGQSKLMMIAGSLTSKERHFVSQSIHLAVVIVPRGSFWIRILEKFFFIVYINVAIHRQ
jgi:hypothetical protein